MRAASVPPSFASGHVPGRQRLATLTLVVLLHLALLLLLLRIAPQPMAPLKGGGLTTVELIAEPELTPAKSRADAPPPPQRQRTTEDAAAELTAEEAPVVPESSIWSQVIPLTRDQLAATDRAIRTAPRAPPAPRDEGAGDSRFALRAGTDDSVGPGSGPNGETLYNARWQREPTDAELNGYLPGGRPRAGWGIIACRTVPGYRVEDCREIAQSPGSGLAGAIRRAAWQFRIHPPRIGGRPMIGEWVRIRIDYTVNEVGSERPAGR